MADGGGCLDTERVYNHHRPLDQLRAAQNMWEEHLRTLLPTPVFPDFRKGRNHDGESNSRDGQTLAVARGWDPYGQSALAEPHREVAVQLRVNKGMKYLDIAVQLGYGESAENLIGHWVRRKWLGETSKSRCQPGRTRGAAFRCTCDQRSCSFTHKARVPPLSRGASV